MGNPMTKRAKGAPTAPLFEEALSKLEAIVQQLEAGDLPLEESLKLYEEGVRLSRACSDRLQAAERRIEILERARDGSLRELPFATDSGEE